MVDKIWAAWLEAQYEEAMDLARQSELLRIAPADGEPPQRFVVELRCKGLVKDADGISVHDQHVIGIAFPEDYLRVSSHPGQVLTWLGPRNAFHPNIGAPFCCVGHIPPGMTLVSLLQQVWQMVTWQRFTPREDDALNPEACVWARHNLERFPIDSRRSMLTQTLETQCKEAADVLD